MFKYLSPLFIAAMMIVPMNAQQSTTKTNAVVTKPTQVTDGKQMYTNYCASCHGATGIGNGSAAAALKSAPANLTLLTANNKGVFPGDHVSAVLQFGATNPAHGSTDMPIWGDLFSTMGPDGRDQAKLRIRNISDYLKTLQK
jgi:mono/diheme cytochrome c family protein